MKLFNDEVWRQWTERVRQKESRKSGKKKTTNHVQRRYPHLDPFVGFEDIEEELRTLAASGTLIFQNGRSGLLPFLKYVDKTPRFKSHQDESAIEEFEFRKFEMKKRPIVFSGHFDSYLYSFYSFALNKLYSAKLGACEKAVLAYREDLNGKCNIQFAKEVFDTLESKIHKEGTYSAIGLDIKSYFDNINHKRLKKNWLDLIEEENLPADQYQLFKSITQYRYLNYKSFRRHFNISKWKIKNKLRNGSLLSIVDIPGADTLHDRIKYLASQKLITSNRHKVEGKWMPKNKGIPQGNPMSSVLSNLYLLDFDKLMFSKSQDEDFVYRRYSDDILILCHPDRLNELSHFAAKELTKTFDLQINLTKADAVTYFKDQNDIKVLSYIYDEKKKVFDENPGSDHNGIFQYLGFEYNGKNVLIRSKSVAKFYRKMTKGVFREIATYVKHRGTTDGFSKHNLTERYTHLGKQNFVTYAYKAASKSYSTKHDEMSGMDSSKIKGQLSNHVQILDTEVEKIIAVFNERLKHKASLDGDPINENLIPLP